MLAAEQLPLAFTGTAIATFSIGGIVGTQGPPQKYPSQ
jgi:hypothetical protein